MKKLDDNKKFSRENSRPTVNHGSRPVKSITVIIIEQYLLPGNFESLW